MIRGATGTTIMKCLIKISLVLCCNNDINEIPLHVIYNHFIFLAV